MLFDPKSRQQQTDLALAEARKVLAEYEHHDANTSSSVNLTELYGKEPDSFTD